MSSLLHALHAAYFDPRDSLLGQPFWSTNAKASKFKRALYIAKRRTLSS